MAWLVKSFQRSKFLIVEAFEKGLEVVLIKMTMFKTVSASESIK
jgi:hypothetical protein